MDILTLNLIKSGFFFMALCSTVYFACKFIIWIVWKVKPDNFSKGIDKIDIFKYNYIGIMSALCWTFFYYLTL